jgi:hypothetical protein
MAATSAAVDGINTIANALGVITNLLQPGKLDEARRMFQEGIMSAAEYKRFIEEGPTGRQKMLEGKQYNAGFAPMEETPLSKIGPPSGVGETSKDVLKIIEEQDAAKLEMVNKYYEAANIIEQEYLDAKLEASQNTYAIETEFWLEELERRYKADEEYTKKKIALQKAASRTFISDANYAMQYFATQNKQAFEAYKVYKIAEATISGIDSAIKAWNAGMSTGGPWAPFVAAAYATASLARTGALISQIQSTSFGGGGSSGGGGGGSSSGSYSSGSTMAQGTEAYNQEEDKRGQMTIIIEGNVIGQEDYIIDLAEEISKAVEDKDVRLVASNARIAEALV